ncbi:MAG: aminotransferase class V-fold PLP-dependent enzyme [Paracoccaceae bacterium]
MPLHTFKQILSQPNITRALSDGIIGEGVMIPGLNGPVPLVYADYVASGRALHQVEDFVSHQVLPYYANSHTQASYCGGYMTKLREDARAEIARLTNAGDDHTVIFAGSGATAGLNRLISLFAVNQAENPVVFVGPYEHHSNLLPWRESKATVVEIPESQGGGPDMVALHSALLEYADCDLKIGAFSAASNVTGIITDPEPITRILKDHDALAVWDYAGAGPYLPIDMQGDGAAIDAAVVSCHKFVGGPGASGVLIIRDQAVRRDTPSWPGGGTVSFVSPWAQDYSTNLAEREEAGTPNVIGDIRAALVFLVKEAVGQAEISAREAKYSKMALDGWSQNPRLKVLGHATAHRLPIFSFMVTDQFGHHICEQEFTRALSQRYGIQARGGCACAGPYGHRLLNIDQETSEKLRAEILAGNDMNKPGWVRVNFGYLMDEKTVQFIIDAVDELASNWETLAPGTANAA